MILAGSDSTCPDLSAGGDFDVGIGLGEMEAEGELAVLVEHEGAIKRLSFLAVELEADAADTAALISDADGDGDDDGIAELSAISGRQDRHFRRESTFQERIEIELGGRPFHQPLWIACDLGRDEIGPV